MIVLTVSTIFCIVLIIRQDRGRTMQAVQINGVISPCEEMNAYETLWGYNGASVKQVANQFDTLRKSVDEAVFPSQVLESVQQSDQEITQLHADVAQFLKQKQGFSIAVDGTFQYPEKLRDAKYPIALFYYQGDINLTDTPTISVVGSRACSKEGISRARKLAKMLVENGYTIISGLAKGVDTAAMTAAIAEGGHVIGVIGTPIDEYYPKENAELQRIVAQQHLLISQVPFYRYAHEPFAKHKYFFPERNKTMSALAEATVIVEASDTSGTLTQARACLEQGRKLFILNSCFEQANLKWPHTYEKRGAIRANDIKDILQHLKQ